VSFPRYPSYKDSCVAWLGEVPAHWVVRQGRRLYSQKRDSALPDDEQLSATQKYGVVPQRLFMEMEDQKVTLALSGLENFKHVESEDFVISLRSFQGGIERSKYSGCVSPAYTVLRSVYAVDAGFMAYVLKSAGYIAALQSVTDGIRDGKNISYEQFGQIGLPYPVYAEQLAIAAFLDRETAKIDTLVSEQEKLIALLKEKRQAVISHAVTKGLDPDAPMKDSGIEWLGEVPAHWATPAMYMRYSSELGKMLDSSKITGEHLIPYMRNVDVQWGAINFDDLPYMDIHEDEYERYIVKTGDLLVCEGGEVGRAAIVPTVYGAFGYQKALHRLRALDASEDSTFMYFTLLWAANTGIFDQSGSSTITHLTGDKLRKYRFPKPPVAEQREIAAHLESESAKLDNLSAEAQRAIDLLQERRSALISAAVTGKIDVRGWAERGAA
jgi:type I restriction enzyme S subunit